MLGLYLGYETQVYPIPRTQVARGLAAAFPNPKPWFEKNQNPGLLKPGFARHTNPVSTSIILIWKPEPGFQTQYEIPKPKTMVWQTCLFPETGSPCLKKWDHVGFHSPYPIYNCIFLLLSILCLTTLVLDVVLGLEMRYMCLFWHVHLKLFTYLLSYTNIWHCYKYHHHPHNNHHHHHHCLQEMCVFVRIKNNPSQAVISGQKSGSL